MDSGMSIQRILIRINKIKLLDGKIKDVPVFGFRNSNNKCNKNEITRIKKLCIPPVWKNVCISNSELSHLQATGIDEKGRMQYIYHPMWVFLTSSTKFERMGKFSKKIGLLENKIKKDIQTLEPIAIMFRILQKTHIRVGNDCYAKDNNTYGLTSLEKRHVKITGCIINLSFVGKKSVAQSVNFTDPYCLQFLKNKLKVIGNKERIFEISPSSLNLYLQNVTGGDFTCKDFRTYASNILFLKILCRFDVPTTKSETLKNLKSTYDQVADKLGHSRAISKKSYVMSVLQEQYLLNPKQFSNKNPKSLFIHFTK